MSTSSSVSETAAIVPPTGQDASITSASGSTTSTQSDSPASGSNNATTQPERKTLVLMDMGTSKTEENIRGIFGSLQQGSVSKVEFASSSWFVTFSSGDAATEAFQVAFTNSISVKFKTTSTVGAASGTTSAPAAPGQVYYGYQAVPQEYSQYWDGQYQQQMAPDANGHFGFRGGRPAGSGPRAVGVASANRSAGVKSKVETVGGVTGAQSAGSAAPGARNGAAQRGPRTSPSGPRQASGASNPRSPNAATGVTQDATVQSVTATAGGAGTAQGRRKPVGERTAGTRRPHERTGPRGAETTVQGNAAHTSSPKSEKQQPNLSLASFPPLPSGSGSSVRPNPANGYGDETFTKYSRDTILATIAGREASDIQRPQFDNSDAPILLTSPQTDLEVNKPLPVGAKFEPLATDKRTRSLSKKSEGNAAPPQPTAAQIVAAAAAKAQANPPTVKVSGATASKPASTTSVSSKPATAASAAKKEDHTKPNKAATQKPAKTDSSSAAPPKATPAAPAALSWADRARAPPAPKKATAPVATPAAAPTSDASPAPTTPAPEPIASEGAPTASTEVEAK